MIIKSNSVCLGFLVMAVVAIANCAVAKPKEISISTTKMSVKEARESLASALNQLYNEDARETFRNSVRDIRFTRRKTFFVVTTTHDGIAHDCSVIFENLTNLSVKTIGGTSYVQSHGATVKFGSKPGCHAWFLGKSTAAKFIDAISVLQKAAADGPALEENDFAAFTANAQNWLTAVPKPEMTDTVRTFKLLAEDAFKRKNFAAALDAYTEALVRHPMWPDGHYNAALLAAETEDYELAAHHMRRYLVLAPDAPDAPAAKDKLLLWQHKALE